MDLLQNVGVQLVLVFLWQVGVYILIRYLVQRQEAKPDPEEFQISSPDPYEIALLHGPQAVAELVVVHLERLKHLRINSRGLRIRLASRKGTPDLPPLVQKALETFPPDTKGLLPRVLIKASAWKKMVPAHLDASMQRLKSEGLLHAPPRLNWSAVFMALGLGAIPVIGLMFVVPNFYLVFCGTILVVGCAIVVYQNLVHFHHATPRGRQYLRQLKTQYGALKGSLDLQEYLLAYAIFNVEALTEYEPRLARYIREAQAPLMKIAAPMSDEDILD